MLGVSNYTNQSELEILPGILFVFQNVQRICIDSQDACEVTGRKIQLRFGPSSGNEESAPYREAEGVSELKVSGYINACSLHTY